MADIDIAAPGANRSALHSALAGLAFPLVGTPIVSGAAPVDADPFVDYYKITTGGTAAQETINLPVIPNTEAFNAPEYIGKRIVFFLDVLTDPADTIKITANGSDAVKVYAPFRANMNIAQAQTDTGLLMTYQGATVVLVWCNYEWRFDVVAGGQNDSSIFAASEVQIISANANNAGSAPGILIVASSQNDPLGVPGNVTISAGDGDGGGAGGATSLKGGFGGTGDGGDVEIDAGNSSSGNKGVIRLGSQTSLPNSDPGDPGALYKDPITGVLKVSL